MGKGLYLRSSPFFVHKKMKAVMSKQESAFRCYYSTVLNLDASFFSGFISSGISGFIPHRACPIDAADAAERVWCDAWTYAHVRDLPYLRCYACGKKKRKKFFLYIKVIFYKKIKNLLKKY